MEDLKQHQKAAMKTDLTKKVRKISNNDFIKFNIDFERYVFVYTNTFKEIYGCSLNNISDPNAFEGFVKITNGKKCIYRKLIGANIQGQYIEMGYRSQSELGVKDNAEVNIKETSWFNYYWHNSESYLKYPFRIAVIGLILTILSCISSYISLFI